MKIKICSKEFKEKDYQEHLENQGIRCIKIIKENKKEIINILKRNKDYYLRWAEINNFIDFRLEDCFKKGSPDFFILDKLGNFYLCEFKSNQDGLSVNQLAWFKKNQDLPLEVVIAIK